MSWWQQVLILLCLRVLSMCGLWPLPRSLPATGIQSLRCRHWFLVSWLSWAEGLCCKVQTIPLLCESSSIYFELSWYQAKAFTRTVNGKEVSMLDKPTIVAVWVRVWIWVGVITQTQHQQRTTKKCEWWFASAVSREDVLRRGRGVYTNRVMQTEMQDTPGVQEQ